VVHGAAHSFLLQDPETLPAIVRELLAGDLGAACARALIQAGLDPAAPPAAVDDAFAPPGSLLRLLGGDPVSTGIPSPSSPGFPSASRTPYYRWTRIRFPLPGRAAG